MDMHPEMVVHLSLLKVYTVEINLVFCNVQNAGLSLVKQPRKLKLRLTD